MVKGLKAIVTTRHNLFDLGKKKKKTKQNKNKTKQKTNKQNKKQQQPFLRNYCTALSLTLAYCCSSHNTTYVKAVNYIC